MLETDEERILKRNSQLRHFFWQGDPNSSFDLVKAELIDTAVERCEDHKTLDCFLESIGNPEDFMTLSEIAVIEKVSRTRIAQIEAKALRKLRNAILLSQGEDAKRLAHFCPRGFRDKYYAEVKARKEAAELEEQREIAAREKRSEEFENRLIASHISEKRRQRQAQYNDAWADYEVDKIRIKDLA